MKKTHTRVLVTSSLFAAIICLSTTIIIIPLPNGFANLGDCFVILAGALLGPVWGTLAAAVGSALADLFLGYTVYAPATFVIKGLMAYLVWVLFFKVKAPLAVRVPLCGIAAETVMVGGYLAFEWALYGAGAIASVAGNAIQGGIAAVAAGVLLPLIVKNKVLSRVFW